MKKIYLLSLFLLCLCTVSFSQNNSVIEPELQQLIDCGYKEKISITVVMKSQAEPSALRMKAAACRDRKMRRNVIVDELKAHSSNSQISLLSILYAEEKKGNVTDISSLWISNSISCCATQEVICAISNRPDIAFIGMDKEVQMLSSTDYMPQYTAVKKK